MPHKEKQQKQLTVEQRQAIELDQKNKAFQLLDDDDDDDDDGGGNSSQPPVKVSNEQL